jgi:2-polyprenyl-6-methoxyphenol hydroxylase-like FAD-dependent oxidoreductase
VVLEQSDGDPKAFRPRAIVFDSETIRLFQTMRVVHEIEPFVAYGGGVQFVSSSYLREGEQCEVLGGSHKHTGGSPTTGGWAGTPLVFGHEVAQLTKDELKKANVTMTNDGWPRAGYFYQPQFEAALRGFVEDMPNVDVRKSTEVASLAEDGSGVTIQTRSTEGAHWEKQRGGEILFRRPEGMDIRPLVEVRAKYVIGCDGAGSRTREGINPDQQFGYLSLDYDQWWLVVDVMLRDDALIGTKLPWCVQQICDPKRPSTFIPGNV